ncbi:MAG: flagellar motor switch protein FliN [Alphaproteobacteria bacterium]
MSEETGGEDVDLTDFSQQEKPPGAPEAAAETKTSEPASGDETRTAADLDAVFDVPVTIAAVLGRTQMEVSDLLKLDEGDVVELDRKVGEAIDIYVNNRLVARGEVVLVEDRLGVTMTEIIKAENN